jgi:hypothetical protein
MKTLAETSKDEQVNELVDTLEGLKSTLSLSQSYDKIQFHLTKLQHQVKHISNIVKGVPMQCSKVKDMSYEVMDSNPYSRLMELKQMGIVHNYW